MSNWFLKLSGRVANIIGSFDHYSEEHQKFLAAGFQCLHCSQTLMKFYGVADVNCYSETGDKVSLMAARLKGKYFECPKCKYRWEIRRVSIPTAR